MTKQAAACPQQKFVMGGHSQGGFVTTQTIARLPKPVSDKVIAVTMFGSPECPRGGNWAERCRSYCNFGDWVGTPILIILCRNLTLF
jgi:pimeloyl-ACP methyl ester carboxylesterase